MMNSARGIIPRFSGIASSVGLDADGIFGRPGAEFWNLDFRQPSTNYERFAAAMPGEIGAAGPGTRA